MRIAVISLVLAAGVFGQTSEQLQKNYGPPSEYTETYHARSVGESSKLRATVTATYSADRRRICEIKVEVFPSFVGFEGGPTPFTKQEEEARSILLKEVVNEVVSKEARGKFVIAGFHSGVSIVGTFEQYERAQIFYSLGERGYAIVTFDVVTGRP